MRINPAHWLAWSLTGVNAILVTIGVGLQLVTGTSYENLGTAGLAVIIVVVFFLSIMGALVAVRLPGLPIGWITILGLTLGAFDVFAYGYASYGLIAHPGSLPWVGLTLVWLSFRSFPFIMLLFTIMLLIFPNGRLLSAGWSFVAWIAVAALVAQLPLYALAPGPVLAFPYVNNPLGVSEATWTILNPLRWSATILAGLCFSAGAVSLGMRLRRAHRDERQQVKWLVYAAIIYALSLPFLISGDLAGLSLVHRIGVGINVVSVIGLLVATAIAIFRYRLYDIDIIINRTLVYGFLTTSLALVYFLSVAVFQRIFSSDSQITIVLSTLTIAVIFAPLRRRIQNDIDRLFYRQKYDAERTLAIFSTTLRNQVDLDDLSETLLMLVEETMQPEHTSLWLTKMD